jgi:hypothetical protein
VNEYAEFLKLCKKKMEYGEKKYGVWDPSKDTKRVLGGEAADELVDASNYVIMETQRHPQLAGDGKLLKQMLFLCYRMARRFEEKEIALLKREGKWKSSK